MLSTRKAVVPIALASLIVLAFIGVLLSVTRGPERHTEEPVLYFGSESENQEEFESWSEHYDRLPSLDKAAGRAPFGLKVPNAGSLPPLVAVYVSRDDVPSQREVYMYFGSTTDGISIQESPVPTAPDYAQLIAQSEADKAAGYLKSDKPFEAVDINGQPGRGVEPGFNLIDGTRVARPGVVDWWKGGVRTTIYGRKGFGGDRLDVLLKIARDMDETVLDPNLSQ